MFLAVAKNNEITLEKTLSASQTLFTLIKCNWFLVNYVSTKKTREHKN